MHLDIHIPNKTNEIFDFLRAGKFLCKNHPDPTHDRYYNECVKHYQSLKEFFSAIGIDLIKETNGDYFYFSDFNNADSDDQRTNKKLKEFIDYIRLFSILNEEYEYFGVGTSFTIAEIEQIVIQNIGLKSKYGRGEDIRIRKELEKEVKLFCNAGYLYEDNYKENRFIVLSSIKRLKSFIGNIVIDDEIFEEIDKIIKEDNGEENE